MCQSRTPSGKVDEVSVELTRNLLSWALVYRVTDVISGSSLNDQMPPASARLSKHVTRKPSSRRDLMAARPAGP